MCNESSQNYQNTLIWLLRVLNDLCKINLFLAIPIAKAAAQTVIIWYFNYCQIIYLGLDYSILSMAVN